MRALLRQELQSIKRLRRGVPETKFDNNYRKDRRLGGGSYGEVFACLHRITGQQFAVKVISKARLGTEIERESVENEVNILAEIHHPNVMRVFEIFEDNSNFYVVSEVMQGTLLTEIYRRRGNAQISAKRILFQIIYAVNSLHERNIVHRDLKPENILVGHNFDIKISDFGFAIKMRQHQQNISVGTPLYMAPELIRDEQGNQLQYGRPVDIWAFGVIAHVLMTGAAPHNIRLDRQQSRADIFDATLNNNIAVNQRIDQPLRGII